MTRKSIGTTVGLAALALAAGPSGAHAVSPAVDSSVTPGDIVFGDVVLETYFDLENTTLDFYSLDGHSLVACVGAEAETPVLPITYGSGDFIDAEAVFKTADPSYTGGDENIFSDLSWLNSNDYDLRFVDFGVFPEEVVAHTTSGSPNEVCVDRMPPITP